MRIYVWHGCKLMGTLDVPTAPGPDLQLDPWADKIHVMGGKVGVRGQIVEYHHGLTLRVADPEGSTGD